MRKDYSISRTLGIIGLGIMGGAMAEALLGAGYAVCGYDPVTAAARRLKRAGGLPLASAAAVAERAGVLISSLPSSAALEDVVSRIPGARARILIEMSTLPLADKERARRRLARAGIVALDCPVSGTAVRLKERTWTIFASGERRAFARARPVLRVLADNIPYVGAYGNGMRMKLVANHLVAILNVASAEAIGFGRRMGLEPREVLEIFGPSPVVGTGVLRLRGGLMVKRRYKPPTMKIGVWQKDMRIIGEMARSVRAATPLFDACGPVFDAALARGYGDADTASVYEVLSARGRRSLP
jgi:3-hydroxyisobutyrate dehydrogenase-like beta-hydroxyacid dehydrogenase